MQCSGFTLGSEIRDYSWGSRDNMVYQKSDHDQFHEDKCLICCTIRLTPLQLQVILTTIIFWIYISIISVTILDMFKTFYIDVFFTKFKMG